MLSEESLAKEREAFHQLRVSLKNKFLAAIFAGYDVTSQPAAIFTCDFPPFRGMCSYGKLNFVFL
jgi:hypothetical protein